MSQNLFKDVFKILKDRSWGAHKFLPLAEELLVIDSCQGRKVPVFLRDVIPEKLPMVLWMILYPCIYWQCYEDSMGLKRRKSSWKKNVVGGQWNGRSWRERSGQGFEQNTHYLWNYEIIHSNFNVLKNSAEMRMKMHFLMQKELRFLKIKL